jgi:hypothetical protein
MYVRILTRLRQEQHHRSSAQEKTPPPQQERPVLTKDRWKDQSIGGVLLNDFEVTHLSAWWQMSDLLVKLAHDAEVNRGADGLDVCGI